MANDTLTLIKVRRQEIARERARLAERAQELNEEDDRLAIAEMVIAHVHSNASGGAGKADATPSPRSRSPKPDGLPPLTEMIWRVLKEEGDARHGLVLMDNPEITKVIQQRWWSGCTTENVGAITWRMWKRGELAKDGTRYSLPFEPKEKASSAFD